MCGTVAHGINFDMTLLTRETALDNWDVIGPQIERALYHGGQYSVRDYYEMVDMETAVVMQCTQGNRLVAIVVLEIIDNIIAGSFHRMLNVMAMAGEKALDGIGQILDFIEQVARAEDCDGMVVTGRKGWTRVLQPHGFSPALVTQYKVF